MNCEGIRPGVSLKVDLSSCGIVDIAIKNYPDLFRRCRLKNMISGFSAVLEKTLKKQLQTGSFYYIIVLHCVYTMEVVCAGF